MKQKGKYKIRQDERAHLETGDRFSLIGVALIIVLGILVYANTFPNKLIYDDETLVEKNEYIRSWTHLKDIFSVDVHHFGNVTSNFYRPIQTLTYMIDYAFWKLNPLGYHITNMLIHIINAILIYIIFFLVMSRWKITGRVKPSSGPSLIALSASLLWLVHPINTICVSYVSSRADPISIMFILLMLLTYMNKRAKSLAPLFFILALLSKEAAIIAPLFLVLYDYIGKGSSALFAQDDYASKKGAVPFFKYLPYLVIIAIYAAARLTILRFPGAAPSMDVTAPLYPRLLTSAKAVITLIRLLILPLGLNISRNIPWEKTIFSPGVLGSILAVGLIFLYAVWARRKERVIAFGIFWFFIAYLPAANIFPINANISEHWMYIPSMGFFLVVSIFLLDKFPLYNPKKNIFIIAGLIVFYGYLAVVRNFDWRDEITFYEKTLSGGTASARVHNNLGIAYGLKNMDDKAMEHLLMAVKLDPNYGEAYSNLGYVYIRKGRTDEALPILKKAVLLKDDLAENHINLAVAYKNKGLLDDAEKEYEKAMKIKPNNLASLNGLGIIYGIRKDYQKAEEFFNKALQIDPDFKDAKKNLQYLHSLMKVKE